ncbi:MAG: transcription antitermination protein NusB [Cyanobacteria bacterium J083]|nr:MAG: transcription antitermination protein NusB [Cyanobacteria bacterium J083]
MASRQQPRTIARELALLSLSQINIKKTKLNQIDIEKLILVAIRTLVAEIQDVLENAAAEIKRGSDRLLETETRANNLNSSKAMLQDALSMGQQAINQLGMALELPEFIHLASQTQVRNYAIEIISTVQENKKTIEEKIESVLVAWQLARLPQVDRNILQIAVAEILFLEIPSKVAINEAVKLAKRYSDEDGFRFINGVLGKVVDSLETVTIAAN